MRSLETFGTKKQGIGMQGLDANVEKIAIYVHNTQGEEKETSTYKNPHKQKMVKQQEAKSICPF